MTPGRSQNNKAPFLATLIFVCIATLLGAGVRLLQVAFVNFPYNDGGMFYVMTQDLINNHFALPTHTTYNLMNIPYAYSPLMFYVSAILSTFGHWPILEIFRILPAVFSILIIPVVYALTRAILKLDLHAVFAALAYAFTPGAFTWLISGGGITRAPGVFFTVLALYQGYLMYTAPTRRLDRTFLTAIFATLAVLCHPQMGWSFSYTMLLFFLLCGRNRRNFIQSAIIAGLALMLSSPWWLTVAAQDGFSVFLGAVGTGSIEDHFAGLTFLLIGIGFVEQVFWGMLGMILGTVRTIATRRFLLPGWLVLTFVMEPRTLTVFISIPLSMLTAIVIVEMILPTIQKVTDLGAGNNTSTFSERGTGHRMDAFQLVATVLFFVMMFSQGIIYALNIPYIPTIYPDQRQAMAWIAANTEPKSNFVILDGNGWAFNDFGEWFPALAQRRSISTVQGREWLGNFSHLLEQYGQLEGCLSKTIDCVENWAASTNSSFTYVVINSVSFYDYTMRQSLLNSPNYQLVYETADVSIFKHTDF